MGERDKEQRACVLQGDVMNVRERGGEGREQLAFDVCQALVLDCVFCCLFWV